MWASNYPPTHYPPRLVIAEAIAKSRYSLYLLCVQMICSNLKFGTGHNVLEYAQLYSCTNFVVSSLQDLTQFNTAHNRQISMVGISEKDLSHKRKQHPLSISFADEEEIINPEDIDPTIGRFRNMVQTTIIPTKVSTFGWNLSL